MLGVLAGLILFTINPIEQLAKAKDAQRQNDIKQLQTALDTYYNDRNCYPLASGDYLTVSDLDANYIKDIPVDPDGRGYAYLEGSTACPQWNAVFTRLDALPEGKTSCPLLQIEEEQGAGTCTPDYFDTGYNFCVISGEVSCAEISTASVPDLGISVSSPTPPGSGANTNTPTPPSGGGGTSSPTPPPAGTATNTPTPTLSPTPSPIPPSYTCSGTVYAYPFGSQNCNAISPITQCDFYGGSLTCYQNRVGTTCVEPICTNYRIGANPGNPGFNE